MLTCDQQLAQQFKLKRHHNLILKLIIIIKMNTTKVKYIILTAHTWAIAEDIDVATASVEKDSTKVATKVATMT
jgi:endonuclease IV